ncbi:MAG TPA: hypothetical protein ENH37_01260 [Deltaproteobacteria bacterium]|nr:hypothetical protein [Deltaproteobacteria bacterium]
MEIESTHCAGSGKFGTWTDLSCAILLIGFCAFLFRGVLFGGHLLFGSDFVGFYQGIKQFLFDQVHHHGSIPYWNPFVFGGMPFWAHPESTIFYPLDFLFYLLPTEQAFGYTMFLHMGLGALFMYSLLRSLGIGYGGSFVGATVFTCNGFIMATLYDGQMFRVQAYIWLPLIICLLNRALKPQGSYLNAMAAGLFWGFQILSGSPQDALYTMMAACLFCLVLGVSKTRPVKAVSRITVMFLVFFGFGTGTAFIQILPTMEFIGLSVRAAFDSYQLVTLGSYPPQGIITAVIPDFFGKYASGDFWVSNVPWSVPLYNLYTGILPLLLLFFISFRNRMDRRLVIFAGISVTGAFILALGSNTPIYRLIYLLPGFDRIRAPAKIIFLYVFGMALLAGIGMDGLFRLSGREIVRRACLLLPPVLLIIFLDGIFLWKKTLVFSFFSPFVLDQMIPGKAAHAAGLIVEEFQILTVLCTASLLIILITAKNVLQRRTAAVLLSLIVLFDLSYMNRGAIRYNDKGYAWATKTRTRLASALGHDGDIFRVGSYPNPMGPNFEMYLGYQTVAGYNPLYLYRYYEYIRAYNRGLLDPGDVWFFYTPRGNGVLMDLLNVKYEISHEKGSFGLRKSCLPRVFFVPGHEVTDRPGVLHRLTRPGFNPREKIIFEVKPSSLPQQDSDGPDPCPANPTEGSKTRILSYTPDKIVASVYAPSPGYLFFSEIFYPGWEAAVDGSPVPVLRGNYIFRVVQVQPGTHLVELSFDPPTIKWGVAVTCLTLLLMAVLWIFSFRRKSSSEGSASKRPCSAQ